MRSHRRHSLEGRFHTLAEVVESILGQGTNLGGVNDQLILRGLSGLNTIERRNIGRNRNTRNGRIDKEGEGGVRLVNLDIRVGNTEVRLFARLLDLREIENGWLVLRRGLSQVDRGGGGFAGESLDIESRALRNIKDSEDGGITKVHVDTGVPATVVHRHRSIHTLVGNHHHVGLGGSAASETLGGEGHWSPWAQ
ncbi:uncharacterized protein N7469_003111 [Penicillium citrinum]|uniref:Uncharacterized protein n=1 Tax=Penicillium citrinum TaxID=5077 RepID=A0A9W9PBP3_PENCI|nr:uncharacterized protein N7469_003111 [Penicillium citrinum]KAJ5241520.1 hypothetical protein N7469_003111 [Penicillium citrinum]